MNKIKLVKDLASSLNSKYWYHVEDDKLVGVPLAISHTEAVAENPAFFGVDKNDIPDTFMREYDPKIMLSAMKNGWVRIMIDRKNQESGFSTVEAANVSDLKAALRKIMDEKVFDETKPVSMTGIVRTGEQPPEVEVFNFSTCADIYNFIGDESEQVAKDNFLPARLLREKKPFAILSAFRYNMSNEENEERHKELRELIEDSGFDYEEMEGAYEGTKEKSFLVYDLAGKDPTDMALEWGKKFEQDEIILADNNGVISFVDPKTGEVNFTGLTKVSYDEKVFDEVGGYSVLNGTKFVFA